MTTLEYALWGAVGGGCVEANQLINAIQRTRTWPWMQDSEPKLGPFIFSLLLRVSLGLALALAAGLSGQISGEFGAIAVGIAAPLIVQEMAKRANAHTDASKNLPSTGSAG